MRVTKRIEQYVGESVRAKFDPKRDALWEEYNAKVNAVKEAVKALADEANEKAVAIAREAGMTLEPGRYSNGETILISTCGTIWNREEQKILLDEEKELRIRERETVSSILLRLELGQTNKEELEDVLASIEV